LIIAIDGPAGSGKSTTARAVARALGFFYVDTGAMYRSFGLAVIRAGGDLSSESVKALLHDTDIQLVPDSHGSSVLLDGEDVTQEIRTSEVALAASRIATIAEVRAFMVELQRSIARQSVEELGGSVLEGRDIGTVVFPDADLKIFLEADLEERTRRRLHDLEDQDTTFEEIRQQIIDRDEKDSARAIAPLRRAADAVSIDTTHLSIDQQVGRIVELAHDLIHNNR
jgi:cytidylate kinase